MRALATLTLAIFVGACGSTWEARDEDSDGKTIAQGDCWDDPEGGAGIGPDADEVWYDGVDQNCDGKSDFDKDGDGFDSPEAPDGTGTDCWDDPDTNPTDFQPLNGLVAVVAASVNTAAVDVAYDGIDANCDGLSDFDQDGDGYDSSTWPQRDASVGDDCFDALTDTVPAPDVCSADPTAPDPASVHPGAEDTWYDGVDADCDGASDFDQDADGFNRCFDGTGGDCDDEDPAIFPNPDVEEVWYNGVDENCDLNDCDQDEDGYCVEGYSFVVEGNQGEGDCWDDLTTIPEDYAAVNGMTQPDAWSVYPGADDAWYDDVDADCALDSDFDQDGDGQDSDFYATRAGEYGEDCNDERGDIYYGAFDSWYDGHDSDCRGNSDYDQDGDGYDFDDYGGSDCDDTKSAVNVSVNESCTTAYDDNCDGGATDLLDATGCSTFYYDGDSDGYGDPGVTEQCWCLAQTGTGWDVANETDCDDSRADVSPADPEVCDAANADEDCDGLTDNADSSATDATKTNYYPDDDNDDYGDEDDAATRYCDDPSTSVAFWSTDNTDCDDFAASINPGEDEVCDLTNTDEDCTGTADNNDPGALTAGKTTYYTDSDADGYGTGVGALYCDLPSGFSANATDCDDTSNGDYPGATETVNNGDDEDCDGVDSCYTDADNDDYGTTAVIDSTDLDCADVNEAPVATDCDDTDADTFPGAASLESATSCRNDDDGDNYGDVTVTGSVVAGTDCDDASISDYPGATETVNNGDDEDCDGVDSCYTDGDHDSFGSTVVMDSDDLNCTDTGEADDATDCDDSDADTFIGSASLEFLTSCTNDDDNDGFGDSTVSALYVEGTDCDDAAALDYPGATETVNNGDDEDCDGVDSCYTDADDDNFGTTTVIDSLDLDCSDTLEATVTTDCDDTDADTFPGAASIDSTTACMNDDDGDNYGDETVSALYVEGTDCNDASTAISPADTEVVNDGIDQDCDDFDRCYTDSDHDTFGSTTTMDADDLNCTDLGEADDATDCDDSDADTFVGSAASELLTSCTNDDDNDGYGDETVSALYVEGTDCNDASAAVSPGDAEVINDGIDQDCDDVDRCYTDSDGDNYGTTVEVDGSTLSCTTGTGAPVSTDCDDSDADTFPGSAASELVTSCTNDDDNDGYGDETVSALYVEGTDCNDASAAVSPGDAEVINDGIDQDCDDVDRCYTDGDSDNYGTTVEVDGSTLSCTTGTGAPVSTDCDDSDADTFPGAASIDSATSCMKDTDGDNYGDETVSALYVEGTDCDDADNAIYPGLADPTDGTLVDDDCDGFVDEDGIAAGSLVITEYFVAQTASDEWFEVYNPGLVDIALDGWTLQLCYDDEPNATLPYVSSYCDDLEEIVLAPFEIGAGEYAVFCGDNTNFAACGYDFTYAAGLKTNNGGFALHFDDGTTDLLVDEVFYWTTNTSDDWPSDGSASIEFDATDLAAADPDLTNDDWSSDATTADLWCETSSVTEWNTAEAWVGTPGAANSTCP